MASSFEVPHIYSDIELQPEIAILLQKPEILSSVTLQIPYYLILISYAVYNAVSAQSKLAAAFTAAVPCTRVVYGTAAPSEHMEQLSWST